jgi:hypothetical protein
MYQKKTKTETAANECSVMESSNHLKNAVSPKNQRNRGNFLICSLLLLVFLGGMNKALGFAGGSGTASDPYLISTPEHLVELFYYLGNTNVHFKMINNIDLTNYLAVGGAGHNGGAGWNPIGNASNQFSGNFNGAGFKITGLWINRSSTDYVGLFGYIDGANISNLGIEIATAGINGQSCVGGLAGWCEKCTIIKCYITGTISGSSNVGGLIGHSDGNIFIGSTITDCYTTSNVSCTSASAGGLVGSSHIGSIINCYTMGNISGNPNIREIGGLVGHIIGSNISNCYTTGNVIGDSECGGLVGFAGGTSYSNCNISNSYATGSISGNGSVGGVVGKIGVWNFSSKISVSNCYATGIISATGEGSGGLVGWQETGTITKCYAICNINGVESVGGLIGFASGTITNCYTTLGNTNGIDYVGGLIGKNIYGTVTNCYATGYVSGNDNVGGFIGSNNGVVNTSFFDYQTTGQIYAIGDGNGSVNNLTGKSTAEMKTKSTFTSVDWDFTTVWGINEGVTYPFFINEPVGINEPVQNINVLLSPNPTTGELRIESGEWRIKNAEYHIYNIMGQTVLQGKLPETSVINVAALPSGIYYLKLAEATVKFVKE